MSNIVITEREKQLLAAAMHEIWADWMKYVFTIGELRTSGEMRLPQWAVSRWQRQVRTKYDALTPSEQASDLEVAERVLYVLAAGAYQPEVHDATPTRLLTQNNLEEHS